MGPGSEPDNTVTTLPEQNIYPGKRLEITAKQNWEISLRWTHLIKRYIHIVTLQKFGFGIFIHRMYLKFFLQWVEKRDHMTAYCFLNGGRHFEKLVS